MQTHNTWQRSIRKTQPSVCKHKSMRAQWKETRWQPRHLHLEQNLSLLYCLILLTYSLDGIWTVAVSGMYVLICLTSAHKIWPSHWVPTSLTVDSGPMSYSNSCACLRHTATHLHNREAHQRADDFRFDWCCHFFSCPTCSFYVLVDPGQQSYRLLCRSSPPHSICLLHPSHSCDHLCPFCLRYDRRYGDCCCSDLGPHGDPVLDLCLHGDPGPRNGRRRCCAAHSSRCSGGGSLRGAPCPPRVCPAGCLSMRGKQMGRSCAVNWSD